MDYIKREIEEKIKTLSTEYACILVTGPRQVGKTTMLKQIMEENREYVSLDDLEERHLASTDPAMFFQIHKTPIFIDEVQYAPELFSYIKIQIDEGASAGSFWLSGSQTFQMMTLASESLAGRVALVKMSSLSQHELYGRQGINPFVIDRDVLFERTKYLQPTDSSGIFERIWRGSLPAFASGKYSNKDVFYSSYLQTYIARDVADIEKISDEFTFYDFIRAAACRIGQVLNIHSIASDVGVSDDTAKRWLGILEKSGIIFYLHPYSNNLLKRTIKSPKLYFFDTGLVSYLTKYMTPDILEHGAINGQILENYVVSEIQKSYTNNLQSYSMWYYRDRMKREIDIVMEINGELYPIEIKKSVNPNARIVSGFSVLDQDSLKRGKGAILCMREKLSALDRDHFIVPIWMI